MGSPLKILLCCHKPSILPPLDDDILLPIHAGKALSDIDLHMQCDNELNGHPCDNISDKNCGYSELTAMYWAWKNIRSAYPDVKYVGLFHYRRFLSFNKTRPFRGIMYRPEREIHDYRVDAEKVIRDLEAGKIIVPCISHESEPIALGYCYGHMSGDYRAMRKVIEEKFPDYFNEFMNSLEFGNQYLLANMFIMKYDDFTAYSEWLFAVLSEVEKIIPWRSYDPYQRRVFGFLSERLFIVWLRKNSKKLKQYSMYMYMDNDYVPREKSLLKRTIEFPMRLVERAIDNTITGLYAFRKRFAARAKGTFGNS